MKKILLTLLLASLMIFAMSANVSAAKKPDDTAVPYWNYMNQITVDVNFSGTTGTATVAVDRIYQVTTLLEGTLTVYEKSGNDWIYVDSKSGSSSRSLSIEFDFDAVRGKEYKVVADITAYGSNGNESDSASKTKTCP